jgi:hypothetical protein
MTPAPLRGAMGLPCIAQTYLSGSDCLKRVTHLTVSLMVALD